MSEYSSKVHIFLNSAAERCDRAASHSELYIHGTHLAGHWVRQKKRYKFGVEGANLCPGMESTIIQHVT
jgi:hypothetical protein